MRLTINDIQYIIKESKRLLLTEISNNAIETLFKRYMPEYKDLLDCTLGFMDTEEYEYEGDSLDFYLIRIGVDDDAVKNHPNMKLKDYLRLAILKEFEINRGKGPVQFLRGIIRICCGDENIKFFNIFEKNEKNVKTFKQLIKYIYNNNIEIDGDFNGMSFNDLNKNLGHGMRIKNYMEWYNSHKDEIKNNTDNVYGDYIVKPMYSFKDTSQYSEYNAWCVTYDKVNYNVYTSDGSQFFFCLKKGFENIPKEVGEGCPLDEYGLSMVSVLVYPNGKAKLVTTRWNHDYDGEDNPELKTLEDVENKLGIPKSAFAINLAPEFEADDISELLKNGVDLGNKIQVIFKKGSFKIIEYRGSNNSFFNALKGNEPLSDIWFTSCKTIDSELGIYMLSKTDNTGGYICNAFSPEGKIFPENIPYAINIFDHNKGLFKICADNNKFNLIQKGSVNPILPKFVRHISPFYEGYSFLWDDDNSINILFDNGKLLWKEFKSFPEIKNRIVAPVIEHNKTIMLYSHGAYFSFIDMNGNYITPVNLKAIDNPDEQPKGIYFKNETNDDIYYFNNDTGDINKIGQH